MAQITYGVVDLAALLSEDGLTFLKSMLAGSRPHTRRSRRRSVSTWLMSLKVEGF
jgi:hypothetical protein